MAIELHTWKLTGRTSLISHNPAETMAAGDGEALSAKKRKYDDKHEAEIRLYKDDDGTFYHPAASIRLALQEAAKGRRLAKKAARTVVAGAVFPAEEKLTILNDKGKPHKNWKIRKCRVKVGTAGVLRCRPMFENWTMMVALEIDTDFVEASIVTELLNIAGRICGIGDERPDTSRGKNGVGVYGRFKAELVN